MNTLQRKIQTFVAITIVAMAFGAFAQSNDSMPQANAEASIYRRR